MSIGAQDPVIRRDKIFSPQLYLPGDVILGSFIKMPRGRVELPTQGFSVLRSTAELPRRGGRTWNRTMDLVIISDAL